MKALLTLCTAVFCGFAANEHANEILGLMFAALSIALLIWGLARMWRYVNFHPEEW